MATIQGTRVLIAASFSTALGPVDPSAVRLSVLFPDRFQKPKRVDLHFGHDPALVRDEHGYHYEILCDFVGLVQYKWSSVGLGEEAVQVGSFRIEAPPF